MARNRQRAKERQARRRAERGGNGDATPAAERDGTGLPATAPDAPADDLARAELQAGAPPSDAGRIDTLLAAPQAPADAILDEESEGRPYADEPLVPERDAEQEHRRGRVTSFLIAVVAELRRVQWPDRAALTTMTGIVLGFVVIAGGYLGLLDFIFSRLLQAIL